MDIAGLYGKLVSSDTEARAAAERRFANLTDEHEKLFGVKAESVFSTSGRTELAGNHTDHNLGKVIAGSINLDTIAAVHATDAREVTFASEGYPTISVDISDLEVHESIYGTTEALIRGVAAAFASRGGRVGGFCANVTSSVFKGSGLSSSAAIEVLVGTIFNSLYNDDRFTTTDLAIMGQEAENIHFGKPSGLMDQIACANGGIVGIDFRNPKDPVIAPVAADFADYGYNLIITTTGGNHADLTADYASIPAEMRTVARFFGEDHLREVDPDVFRDNMGRLRKAIRNDRAVLRALHFFNENDRVDSMMKALQERDFNTYLSLVRQSGDSSFRYLQNIFSPKAPDEQGIALALAMTESFLGDRGAFRVQGGGFAGTIEAYVPLDLTDTYFRYMERVFGQGCCTVLAIRNLPTTRVM